MKHTLTALVLCALVVFCLASCTSKKQPEYPESTAPVVTGTFESNVDYPAYYFGEDAFGYDIGTHHAGYVVFASENRTVAEKIMGIPSAFSNGTVIIRCTDDYYFNGKKQTAEYELIYFNLYPDKKFAVAIPERPIAVEKNEIIGTAFADTGLIIRCKRLSEHLVSCASACPKYDGTYWYFGVESLDSAVPKLLLYQPISSRTDEITFKSDGLSESLEHIVCSSDIGVPNIYPSEGIRIKTQLVDYPEINTNFESNSEYVTRLQYLRDAYGNLMSLDVTVNLDGLVLHVLFPDYFIDYLVDEYTLGNDIYLYANLVYSLNGEMYLYGRDFQQYDPDERVKAKAQEISYANFGDNALR